MLFVDVYADKNLRIVLFDWGEVT